MAAWRLQRETNRLQVVPLQTALGASTRGVSARHFPGETATRSKIAQSYAPLNTAYLKSLVTLCWLQNLDLSIRADTLTQSCDAQHRHAYLLPLQSIRSPSS